MEEGNSVIIPLGAVHCSHDGIAGEDGWASVGENRAARNLGGRIQVTGACMSDWTRLWRLRRGPTRAEVVSGRRGAFGSRGGGGRESRRRALSGGSMRRRRLRRRRSAAASSAEEKEKVRVGAGVRWEEY